MNWRVPGEVIGIVLAMAATSCGGRAEFGGSGEDVADSGPGEPADGAGRIAESGVSLAGFWAMPNPGGTGLPNPASYQALGAGAVRDQVTSLVWQESVDGGAYSWEEGKAFCSGLVLAGSAWRLPTRIELVSLIDFRAGTPTIDPVFPSTPQDWFWSSSPTGDVRFAFMVSFGTGGTSMDGVEKLHRVRCVSAAAEPTSTAHYLDSATGEVQDLRTGLTWEKAFASTREKWPPKRCDNATLNLHTWRAPSMKELQTIIEDSRPAPAFDLVAFPGSPDDSYWSSTAAGLPGHGWAVRANGETETPDPTIALPVRCVR